MAIRASIRGQLNQHQENKLKPQDHVLREVVNSLRDIAIEFHGAGQLRERLSGALAPLLEVPPVVVHDHFNGVVNMVAPEGWQLTLVDPTNAMVIAGFESAPDRAFDGRKYPEEYDGMSGCQRAAFLAKRCYAAMLAATPPVPAPAAQGDATQAAIDVLAERRRQVDGEGWTVAQDDNYTAGQLAKAAASYCLYQTSSAPGCWPWNLDYWKPKGYRANMVRAGALILAEIERLDRAAIAAKAAS